MRKRPKVFILLRVWIVALLALCGCGKSAPHADGVWILRYEGKNLMVLTLDKDGTHGTLARPAHMESSSEGTFSEISGKVAEHSGQVGAAGSDLSLKLDNGDELALHVTNGGGLEVRPAGEPVFVSFAPWKFVRAPDGELPQVATEWTKVVTPEIRAVQDKLKEMVTEDQALRNAPTVSGAGMTAMTAKHRPEIERIHKIYGWPTQSQFGQESAGAFWLLVQHQEPDVQGAWLPELASLAEKGEASRQNYALLFDRVQKGLGTPQRWGTQVSCVEGRAVLDPVEDTTNLDKRRAEMFMPPMEEYMTMMQAACAKMRP
jgi:hypothetical protein